jgi:hypothetical protein
MKNTTLPTLPNGLPLWKQLCYKVTNEKCRVIKINDAISTTAIDSITVDVIMVRKLAGVEYNYIMNDVPISDLIVWNESMNPPRKVTYKTRKKQARTVYYN